MKFKSKLIALLASTILLFNISFAYGENDITIKNHIDEVKTSNTEYTLMLEKLPREIKEFEKATQLSKAIDQDALDNSSDDYNLILLRDITPLEREKVVLDLKYNIMKKENEITINSTSNYYNYIIALKDYENAKSSYETTLKEYESKKKEKELGVVSEIEYLNFEQEYYNAFITYLNKTNEFEELRKDINISVSKPINDEIDFKIVDISTVDTNYSIDINKFKELAFNNSYQIKSLQLQNEVNERTLKAKSRYAGFTNIVTEMNNLNDSIKENNLMINDIKFDIEYNLIKLSNELTIQKNKYAIAEMQYNLDLKEFNSSKIKFERGLISQFDYIKASQNLINSEIVYNKSRVEMAIKVFEAKNYVEENTVLLK